MQDVDPTDGYSDVLLMILSPSDTTPSFGYKQNKLLAQPHLPIRHKPASATKATK
jgi:hypothetical protein